jgi:hypothetical protein
LVKSLHDVFEYYTIDPRTGCWNWTRAKRKGYGVIVYEGRQLASHRVSYQIHKGPIAEGKSVCHSCDNPACINPDHLFEGTHRENMIDKEAKGRGNHVSLKGEDNPNCIVPDASVISLLKDYIAGMSHAGISSKYGISVKSVPDFTTGKSRAWLHGNHGCPTLEELKAARNLKPGAVLTAETVLAIRRRLASGAQGKDLATEYGIHKATISDIKLRKIWKDI